MKWRDELWRDPAGNHFFITAIEIVNEELDQTYTTNVAVHDMVNMCVMFGVKVGAA